MFSLFQNVTFCRNDDRFDEEKIQAKNIAISLPSLNCIIRTVTLPLMRPGIANAFLLGFIESLADFGNPLVLGAEYDVLSTEIFFAIVGAQYDETKAAILAMILLSVVLVVFYLQNQR